MQARNGRIGNRDAPRPVAWRLILALALSGCTGTIGQAEGGGSATRTGGPANPASPTGAGGDPAAPGEGEPGPMPLRRLTASEYGNTVRDLLHLTADAMPDLGFPADPYGTSGFELASAVGEVDVSRLGDAADALASLAAKSMSSLLPCDPAKVAEADCARLFISSFGRRAFRRALGESEIADLGALFDDARKNAMMSFADSIGQVVRGVLQAPQFLYRWELGPRAARPTGNVVALVPDELASRLSYFLWSTMPDDALFASADHGQLAAPADVEREARRMLADPRAKATIDAFHRQWLRLAADPSTDLGRSMEAETYTFVENLFTSGNGRLDSLLLSPATFVSASLADIYGVTGVTGAALVPRTLNPEQRFGLLTQASFLSTYSAGSQSHPVKRGAWIYRHLMCQDLPDPPPNVPQPDPPKDGVSNRVRFASHAQNACAKACHGSIDPIGFAFESYDGVGRWRTTDGGEPVDASGTVDLDGVKARPFSGAKDLVGMLVASPTVQDCMVTQWSRFALARAELPTEQSALAPARAAFTRSNGDLREVIIAITQTSPFLGRTPTPGEVLAP